VKLRDIVLRNARRLPSLSGAPGPFVALRDLLSRLRRSRRPRDLLYRVYERRLRRALVGKPMPRHVGVMCDGNRRWARAMGFVDPNDGHRVGAVNVRHLLEWCDEAGVEHVTLYLLATDNLRRPTRELYPLLQIIEDLASELAEENNPWRLHIVGALDLLPSQHAMALKTAEERTRTRSGGAVVNMAVGYGGRREITDAVRALLHEHARSGGTIEELAEVLDVEHIAEHLYTAGQPDPDLVIRTSGEQRLSGFLLWQSAHSEFYFCDVNWPGFRKVDFLRALRSYADRQRRFGA
jgi:short-chain Z-isoprenyl diphosphate synthase